MLALLALTLSACETAPRAGMETRAQVMEVFTDRNAVRDGYPDLFAAIRAGVTRKDLEDGRLIRTECAVPDATAPLGHRWFTLTTLVPADARPPRGAFIHIRGARGPWPDTPTARATRLHGTYAGLAEGAAAPAGSSETPTLCQPAGQPAGQWRVKVVGPMSAWNFDFAQAALQRQAVLRDEDFAAGRVVRLGCQLKVVDGGDWYAPTWVARAPDAMALKPGDVVRLRAGAESESKDTGPPAEVLERWPAVKAPGGNALVRCH
ncbi:hypothetical protein ACLIJR_07405 [Hydrogenophaga sp. XSHU_21]